MNVQITTISPTWLESTSSELSAQLYLEKEDEKIEFLKSITVPVQNSDSELLDEKLNVDPGKYLLQILLPDGRTISKDFEVKSDRTKERIVIYLPHEGPHEWTTMHAFVGNFNREAQLTEGFTKSLGNYRSIIRNFKERFELSLLKSKENSSHEIFAGNKTIENLSNFIQNNLSVESAIEKIGKTNKIDPTQEDNNFAMFRISYLENISNFGNTYSGDFSASNLDIGRYFLIQKSVIGGTLTSLPTPWINPKRGDQADIEVLVRKYKIGEPLDIAMTVNEPVINTVLGYLNVGAVQQANHLINSERAIQMLFEKMESPFSAVVGAYILILNAKQNYTKSDGGRWKLWVSNLDRWFSWLPDGAILNGSIHFRLRDYQKDNFDSSYNNSLQALNRAFDRGLPFFTFSFKLMIDGFRYFANEGDAQAKERLALLENIANQTDPSQPFLTINFSNHWKKHK